MTKLISKNKREIWSKSLLKNKFTHICGHNYCFLMNNIICCLHQKPLLFSLGLVTSHQNRVLYFFTTHIF